MFCQAPYELQLAEQFPHWSTDKCTLRRVVKFAKHIFAGKSRAHFETKQPFNTAALELCRADSGGTKFRQSIAACARAARLANARSKSSLSGSSGSSSGAGGGAGGTSSVAAAPKRQPNFAIRIDSPSRDKTAFVRRALGLEGDYWPVRARRVRAAFVPCTHSPATQHCARAHTRTHSVNGTDANTRLPRPPQALNHRRPHAVDATTMVVVHHPAANAATAVPARAAQQGQLHHLHQHHKRQ